MGCFASPKHGSVIRKVEHENQKFSYHVPLHSYGDIGILAWPVDLVNYLGDNRSLALLRVDVIVPVFLHLATWSGLKGNLVS